MYKLLLLLSLFIFSLSHATSIEELKEKAKKGTLSQEEYLEYVKYGLCTPLKKNFWEDKERGWLFGEFCDKEYLTRNYMKQKQKENHPQKESPKDKKEQIIGMTGTGSIIVKFPIDKSRLRDDKYLSKLDAKKLRYLYQELLDEITTNPTLDNVKDFLYVQDYIQRRSLKVARVWQEAILTDQKLSPVGKFKTSPMDEQIIATEMKKDRELFFKKNQGKIGLYVFIKGDCPYCKQFLRVLQELYFKRKVIIRLASKDFCPKTIFECEVVPELFDKFSIYIVPTTMLIAQVGEDKYKYKIIAVGLNSAADMENRIVYYYKYLKTGKHIDDRTIIWGNK